VLHTGCGLKKSCSMNSMRDATAAGMASRRTLCIVRGSSCTMNFKSGASSARAMQSSACEPPKSTIAAEPRSDQGKLVAICLWDIIGEVLKATMEPAKRLALAGSLPKV